MGSIVGKTIVKIRLMTKKEMEEEGWEVSSHGAPTAIELSGGTVIYPSRDSEGNGGGALFGYDKDGNTFFVMPEKK